MDRLDTLRVFVAVAEAGGFAAAARHLQMSPPAVTRAVVALERRIGARLLHRTTRTVRPTEAGERFLVDAKRILAELAEAEALAGGAYAEPQGQLAVTAPVLFGHLYVAPLVLDFLRVHPRLRVRSFFVDRLVNLMDEGFDVAVRIARLPDSSLTAIPVGAVRRVVVAAPAYLAVHGEPREPGDLARHQVIGFSPSGAAELPWRFATVGAVHVPPARLVTNHTGTAIAAALAGEGLTRVLSYQVDAELRAGRLRVVLAGHEPPPIPVQLVYPEGRKAAAKVRAFVDHAVDRLRQEPVLRGDVPAGDVPGGDDAVAHPRAEGRVYRDL